MSLLCFSLLLRLSLTFVLSRCVCFFLFALFKYYVFVLFLSLWSCYHPKLRKIMVHILWSRTKKRMIPIVWRHELTNVHLSCRMYPRREQYIIVVTKKQPVESKTRTYHGRIGSGRREAGRRGGAGPGRTGRRRVGLPRTQPSLLPPSVSKTSVLNVSSRARTKEILSLDWLTSLLL